MDVHVQSQDVSLFIMHLLPWRQRGEKGPAVWVPWTHHQPLSRCDWSDSFQINSQTEKKQTSLCSMWTWTRLLLPCLLGEILEPRVLGWNVPLKECPLGQHGGREKMLASRGLDMSLFAMRPQRPALHYCPGCELTWCQETSHIRPISELALAFLWRL